MYLVIFSAHCELRTVLVWLLCHSAGVDGNMAAIATNSGYIDNQVSTFFMQIHFTFFMHVVCESDS